jgi:ATP-dependent RNA helicase RhlE
MPEIISIRERRGVSHTNLFSGYTPIDKENKNSLLVHLLQDKTIKTALVFTRTKHGADKVARFLQKHRIKAEAILGNKSQNARQRALTNFKAQTTRVLVATDIAARGIDVDDLEYVINIDMPNIPETYVHRIGRTGRAGAKGTACSFCHAEEREYLRDVEKLITMKIPVIDDHPFPMANPSPLQPFRTAQDKGNAGHPGPKPASMNAPGRWAGKSMRQKSK